MASYEFILNGTQIGTFSSVGGVGNASDRVTTLEQVSAIGSETDLFTIRIEQAGETATEFAAGQMITIYDSSGSIVMARTDVQPNTEQGLGAGDEHMIIASTGFLIDVGGLAPGPEQVHYASDSQPATDGIGDNDGNLDFVDLRASFPCFAKGTFIDTPSGLRPIETLKTGDFISTLDNGPTPIIWLRSRTVDLNHKNSHQRPILISKGALGHQRPTSNLILSPQHQVFFEGENGANPGQKTGTLRRAKALTATPGIRVMKGRKSVEYFSILLPTHQLIWANNCLCESFYPGRYIVGALPPFLRQELQTLFPLLRLGGDMGYGPTARPSETVQATIKTMTKGEMVH